MAQATSDQPQAGVSSDQFDLFVTGASGLVGSAVLDGLDPARYGQIHLLQRGTSVVPEALQACANARVINGDLEDPASYSGVLSERTLVLHLAALTGSASADDHDRVNRKATEDLLAAAGKAGVAGILFVSTIAVAFERRAGYAYADAKASAEEAVRASGLPHTIVRPTMVFGPDSPVWSALAGLARAKLVPVPGGGEVQVQPIWVTDLADTLLKILQESRFAGETLELGGADTVTMDELLSAMHRELSGNESPRLIHLPLGPVLPVLRLAETVLPFQLPVTAGQFYSFVNDGVARDAHTVPELHAPSWTLARMLQAQAELEDAGGSASEVRNVLAKEAESFGRYLLGVTPTSRVVETYADPSNQQHVGQPDSRFDAVLYRWAMLSQFTTRGADLYARLFRPNTWLRRKLILLLALAEVQGPDAHVLGAPTASGLVSFCAGAAVRGVISVLALAVSIPVLAVSQVLWGKREGA